MVFLYKTVTWWQIVECDTGCIQVSLHLSDSANNWQYSDISSFFTLISWLMIFIEPLSPLLSSFLLNDRCLAFIVYQKLPSAGALSTRVVKRCPQALALWSLSFRRIRGGRSDEIGRRRNTNNYVIGDNIFKSAIVIACFKLLSICDFLESVICTRIYK